MNFPFFTFHFSLLIMNYELWIMNFSFFTFHSTSSRLTLQALDLWSLHTWSARPLVASTLRRTPSDIVEDKNINELPLKDRPCAWILKNTSLTGWLFEPLCCLADFPCESKLSQIKSSPHRNLSGLPVILAKTPFATLIEKHMSCSKLLNVQYVRIIGYSPQAVFQWAQRMVFFPQGGLRF